MTTTTNRRELRTPLGLVTVILGALAAGCGGEVDSSAVVTADGQARSSQELYASPASGSRAATLPIRDLLQATVDARLISARLRFDEQGRLGVMWLTQREYRSDARGDGTEEVPLRLYGDRLAAAGRGRSWLTPEHARRGRSGSLDRDRAEWPKRCGCGHAWSQLEWMDLRRVGVFELGSERLELRQCECQSTMAAPVA